MEVPVAFGELQPEKLDQVVERGSCRYVFILLKKNRKRKSVSVKVFIVDRGMHAAEAAQSSH
jgi:hypothetical protein